MRGGGDGINQVYGVAADPLQLVGLGDEQALARLKVQPDADDDFGAGLQAGLLRERHAG